MEYTENQIKAIKRLQYYSHTDSDFQENTNLYQASFKEVVECGFWDLDDFEEIGASMCLRRETKMFYENKTGRVPSKTTRRTKLIDQLSHKAKSLNKRDGIINRYYRKSPF